MSSRTKLHVAHTLRKIPSDHLYAMLANICYFCVVNDEARTPSGGGIGDDEEGEGEVGMGWCSVLALRARLDLRVTSRSTA
jgi:hypothetical protein